MRDNFIAAPRSRRREFWLDALVNVLAILYGLVVGAVVLGVLGLAWIAWGL